MNKSEFKDQFFGADKTVPPARLNETFKHFKYWQNLANISFDQYQAYTQIEPKIYFKGEK